MCTWEDYRKISQLIFKWNKINIKLCFSSMNYTAKFHKNLFEIGNLQPKEKKLSGIEKKQ